MLNKTADTFSTPSFGATQTVIKLRWYAVLGHVMVLAVGRQWLELEVPLQPIAVVLGVVLGVVLLSNFFLSFCIRSNRPLSLHALGVVLSCDTALLAYLLSVTGGVTNPFSVLFLVNITAAASVLNRGWTLWIAGLAIGLYGLLFSVGDYHHHHHAAHDVDLHLRGMWIAFVVTAMLVTFFLYRILHEREEQHRKTEALRRNQSEKAQLASLATLAAGAAHELGTPLSTIALVAGELAQSPLAASPEWQAELAVLRTEVARCRNILMNMGVRFDHLTQASQESLSLSEVFVRLQDKFSKTAIVWELDSLNAHNTETVSGPIILDALSPLIQNACDAVLSDGTVTVRGARLRDMLMVEVRDTGTGVDPDTLKKIGQPFFTTKMPGSGMGLGVYLASTLLQQIGGFLKFDSEFGKGTVARVEIPLRA